MKKVVIVGAGRLGKGFIAETFDNAGWSIVFLDKDPRVKEALDARGEFHVKVHRRDCIQNRVIRNFKTFLCDEEYSCMEEFLTTNLVILPIYPEDFEEAGRYLTPCFEKMSIAYPMRKMTLICITNKNYLIPQIEEYFTKGLSEEGKYWFGKNVVIRDSIIRRSTDAASSYAAEIDTVAVNSLLIQGPVNTNFENVEWMEVTDNVEMLKDIKVTAVNGPHATLAFAGYLKGFGTIPEAEADKEIAELEKRVTEEIIEGIMKEYPVTKEEVHKLIYFAPAKGVMPDSIYRVAYDPIRKVSRGDRLTGAAEVNYRHGVSFDAIAEAIAAGFGYAEPRDANAKKLQAEIKELGIEAAVSKYIGFPVEHAIVKRVVEKYYNWKERGLIC